MSMVGMEFVLTHLAMLMTAIAREVIATAVGTEMLSVAAVNLMTELFRKILAALGA